MGAQKKFWVDRPLDDAPRRAGRPTICDTLRQNGRDGSDHGERGARGPAQAGVRAPDSPPPHAVGADGGAWYRGRPAPV